jgi:hypothetical protein
MEGFLSECARLPTRTTPCLRAILAIHPLQFKKVGRFWSVRVGTKYRALAVESDGNLIWFWIGSHADYDALIG